VAKEEKVRHITMLLPMGLWVSIAMVPLSPLDPNPCCYQLNK